MKERKKQRGRGRGEEGEEEKKGKEGKQDLERMLIVEGKTKRKSFQVWWHICNSSF